jgi:toxin ParE1/3/4
MKRHLVVHPRVANQGEAACDWYETQRDGLSEEFIDELEAAIQKAQDHPLLYQKVHSELRRVLLRRFPYAVFFVATDTRVSVLAVLRQSENPAKWRRI